MTDKLKIGPTKFSKGGEISILRYYDENLCLRIVDSQTGITELTASVNLAPEEQPNDDCVFIKDYSENEGVLAALIAADIVEPTGRTVQSQYVEFPEVRLLFNWKDIDVWGGV